MATDTTIDYPDGQRADPGGKIQLKIRYTGPDPKPNDAHIYVKDAGDSSYPDRPSAGWDIDPPGSLDLNWPVGSSAGVFDFKIEWTWKTNGQVSRRQFGSTEGRYRALAEGEEDPKSWDWLKFFLRILGGALASAGGSALLNWWTVVAFVPCLLTGALGGAVGSAIGAILVFLFDAPRIRWTNRSLFLFVLFFSLALTVLFGLLGVGLEREVNARGEFLNRVVLGVAAVSAFLAVVLGGVLSNLRREL